MAWYSGALTRFQAPCAPLSTGRVAPLRKNVPSEEKVRRFFPTPCGRLAVTSHAPTRLRPISEADSWRLVDEPVFLFIRSPLPPNGSAQLPVRAGSLDLPVRADGGRADYCGWLERLRYKSRRLDIDPLPAHLI